MNTVKISGKRLFVLLAAFVMSLFAQPKVAASGNELTHNAQATCAYLKFITSITAYNISKLSPKQRAVLRIINYATHMSYNLLQMVNQQDDRFNIHLTAPWIGYDGVNIVIQLAELKKVWANAPEKISENETSSKVSEEPQDDAEIQFDNLPPEFDGLDDNFTHDISEQDKHDISAIRRVFNIILPFFELSCDVTGINRVGHAPSDENFRIESNSFASFFHAIHELINEDSPNNTLSALKRSLLIGAIIAHISQFVAFHEPERMAKPPAAPHRIVEACAELGVQLTGNNENDWTQIKKSFRMLSLAHHPDKNPNDRAGAEARFKRIQDAYQILSERLGKK